MNAKKTFPQWISSTHLPLHNCHTSSQNNLQHFSQMLPKHFSAEVFHIYVPYIFLFLTTNKRAIYLCNFVIQHENDIGVFAETSVLLMKDDVFVVVFLRSCFQCTCCCFSRGVLVLLLLLLLFLLLLRYQYPFRFPTCNECRRP